MDTKSTNKTLLEDYRKGNTDAFDELINLNMGLVRSASKRFIGRGTEYDDLVQIGTIGLIKAARAFNEQLGYEFSTYAFTMIIGEIRRHLRDDGLIKVSRNTKKVAAQLLHEKEKYIERFGEEPTISYLAEKCNISKEEAVFSLDALIPPISFNGITEDENELTLEKKLGIDFTDEYIEKLALKEALSRLTPEEKTIIQLRYVAEKTQCEIAKRLNTSQVKISRQEKKILVKLREMLK